MVLVKKIGFVLIVIVMVFPAIQGKWSIIKEPELQGDFKELHKPDFTWSAFYSNTFQAKFEPWLEQNIGFHNSLVRLTNQLDYSLYRKPNAEGIVIGEQDYIFEYDYIRQLTGRDYVGMDFMDEKLRHLKYVQDYLKSVHGIDFMIVFMPGKASFYKELIPAKYLKKDSDSTNYKVYLEEMKKRDIRYVNLNTFFHDLKKNSKYPLFPKYGTHWSIYGMSRASKVLIDSLESFTGKKFNDYDPDSLYFSTHPLRTDYDGGKALNLLCNMSREEFAYPFYRFGDDPNRFKPRVLTIGDSFYWNIFNAGIPKNLFANEAFWYYNHKVYPDFYSKPVFTSDLNLKKEVGSMDVIMVMVTERFLNIFDWKLIDQLYYLYTPDYIENPIYDFINDIVLDDKWFNKVIKEAIIERKDLGDALLLNASNHYYNMNKNDFMIRYGLKSYINYVSQNPTLINKLTIKSGVENRSFDELLIDEAKYLFKLQQPLLYDTYIRILEKEKFIETDTAKLDSISLLAGRYYCKLNDMIFLQAKQMVIEEDIQAQIDNILSDENWTQDLIEKAKNKNISFKQMLREDAIYMLNNIK